VVVANKLDKVKKSQILSNLETIRIDLELPEECPVIPFSAEKGTGRDELVRIILDCVNQNA
jgi:GTP-binding protein